ncbi:MAG: L-serine ammonia-lyase [Actinomycetes bacterium]
MTSSVFELFSFGIGPSSSHTVGPMRAARLFVSRLADDGLLPSIGRVRVDLYGSLAATGRGHGTDKAVTMGLLGHRPETVEPETVSGEIDTVNRDNQLDLLGQGAIRFVAAEDVIFHLGENLPGHANGLRLTALDKADEVIRQQVYYSIGGGFVLEEGETVSHEDRPQDLPYPFHTAQDLLDQCRASGLSIAGLMLCNETALHPELDVHAGLLRIWTAMDTSIQRGLMTEGILPGALRVRRRAPNLGRKLAIEVDSSDPLRGMDWLTVYALAVNEENAAGGRVVTAPTNGAAGVLPAVLRYYRGFVPGSDDDGIVRFLLTAGAIGLIYLQTASISGAEVGCQGEVGSACSMAAAGYAAVLGGTPAQIENAAEIGMEHNLGLTCDPIGGLVQIPCIERNAAAAVQAVSAARTALRGDGEHVVSLDSVIKTMCETGRDMQDKYKETSLGGLAVNVIEC